MALTGPRAKPIGRPTIARIILGLVIGLSALCVSARGVRWAEVWRVISRAQPAILVVAVGCQVLTVVGKALRWRLLFSPRRHGLTLRRLLALILAGQLANRLVPGRLGDLARTYLASEDLSSAVAAGATVVVEKALDGAILLLATAVVALLTELPPWLKYSTLVGSAVLATLVIGAVVVAPSRGRVREAISSWLQPRLRGRLADFLGNVLDGIDQLQALRDPAIQWGMWGLSLFIWLLGWVTNVLVFVALTKEARLLESTVLLVVLMAGAIFPSVPVQLGVFHYLVVLTLGWFGFAADTALSYGLLLHWTVYAPIALGGALSILWLSRTAVLWGPLRRSGT